MSKPIYDHSSELVKSLIDSGIVPDNCCRVIIDIAYDNAVKVYYEVYGDERLLDIDFAKHILTINQSDKPKQIRDVSDEVCNKG